MMNNMQLMQELATDSIAAAERADCGRAPADVWKRVASLVLAMDEMVEDMWQLSRQISAESRAQLLAQCDEIKETVAYAKTRPPAEGKATIYRCVIDTVLVLSAARRLD